MPPAKQVGKRRGQATVRRTAKGTWPKGQSGNPAGRPPVNASWAETLRRIGDLTPKDAIKQARHVASVLKGAPDGITLRELAALSAYASTIADADGSLLRFLAEREDGHVPSVTATLTASWRESLDAQGIDADAGFETVVGALMALEQRRPMLAERGITPEQAVADALDIVLDPRPRVREVVIERTVEARDDEADD